MRIRLPRSFYRRNTLILARKLLGCVLVHDSPQGRTSGLIVETEAYRGPTDKAAHSYAGRRTPRNEVMYGPAGYAYVYLIYGIHECLNVVGGEEGAPEAVLIRALEPLEGVPLMARRRGLDASEPKTLVKLCSGPGKLTQAMAINRTEHNGIDLRGDTLYILPGKVVSDRSIATTPRINIDYAEEWVDLPWRFVVRDSPHLSVRYTDG